MENPILQETELGEYLYHISNIVGGVCVFSLRLRYRTHGVLSRKRKPNAPTPWGIMDKYSPDRILGVYIVPHSILNLVPALIYFEDPLKKKVFLLSGLF